MDSGGYHFKEGVDHIVAISDRLLQLIHYVEHVRSITNIFFQLIHYVECVRTVTDKLIQLIYFVVQLLIDSFS